MIAESIADLVGGTPLLMLPVISKQAGARIIVKIESFNPMASIKDRIAVAMISDAEKNGRLKSGATIIEPTSGNTGIGLAFIAASRGYRLILTMPDSMSVERRKLLKVFGAELVLTPGQYGMKGAVEKAEEIHARTPGSFMPNQFCNPANPAIHKLTTGKEIWQDTHGKIDFFVAGVGTGGTITGCGIYLKERKADVKVIAVEPAESPVLSGGKSGAHKIQGIGAGFVPEILDMKVIDEIATVASGDAGAMTRTLARKEGVLTGISGGAAVHAAVTIAKRPENQDKTFIVILPDSGERYLSTWVFDEN